MREWCWAKFTHKVDFEIFFFEKQDHFFEKQDHFFE